MSSETDVPKGKVSCLLCRGFISYKNSDRTRFKDHMLNEHDVKFDPDVILAVSVMTQKEKAYIVKSSLQRLSEISNHQIPSSGESLLPVMTPNPPTQRTTPNPPTQRTPNLTPRPGNPRGRPTTQPQNMQFQRMQRPSLTAAASPQIGRPRATLPAPVRQLPNNFPQGTSLSISVVDQSVKCEMCKIVLENSSVLADHMKTEHLSRFSGLVIATPSEKSNKRASLPANVNSSSMLQVRPPPPPIQQVPSKRPRTIETPVNPVNLKRLSMLAPGVVQNYSPQSNRMIRKDPNMQMKNYNSNTKRPNYSLPHNSVASPSQPISTVQSIPSPAEQLATQPLPELPKPDPVIKCNTCSLFVKQSVFKSHKLSHPQERKEEKVITVMKDTGNYATKLKDKPTKTKREEKQIDFVDLGDSDDETTMIPVQKPKASEKNIPCPSCDKKLATNMALKMHMNLKHPVKTEAVDTEELLAEETDEKTKDEAQDKIRNEVESMETLELLDNLVNFLNET